MRTDHHLVAGVNSCDTDSIQAEAINSYLEVEERLHKKAKREEDTNRMLPGNDSSSMPVVVVGLPVNSDEVTAEPTPLPPSRMGRWSQDEKLMFLYGLSLFGKGRWKKIHTYVPDRSLVQIKSHAQKVLKRLDAGENVFRRLEDSRDKLKVLVTKANQKIREKETKQQGSKKKRKRASTRKPAASISCAALNWDSIHDVDVELAIDCAIRRPKDAPTARSSFSTSPAPSLVGTPEEPPGICASQLLSSSPSNMNRHPMMNYYQEESSPWSSYYSTPSRSPPSERAGPTPANTATNVFAAVAALVSLSTGAADADPR